MNGVIFVETLRRSWKQLMWWGGGMALLGWYLGVVIPDMQMLQQYADLMASMPSALFSLLGVDDAAAVATPEGFLSFGFFGYATLILAIWAVMAGISISASEEEDGILDVVLALPVPRWRIIAEKFAAFSLIAVGIVALSLVGLIVGLAGSALVVSADKLVASTLNLLPSLLLMLALTTFAGALFRRKSTALTAASVIIIGSYFMDFIGRNASNLLTDVLRALSFFKYYDALAVMRDGLNPGNVVLLISVTLLLLLGSLWFFERRDIGI